MASYSSQQKAAKEQRKVAAVQKRQQDLQAAIQRREAIRQARIARSQAQVTASNQSVQDSSAAQGGLASITSQLNTNMSFLDQYGGLSDMASQALGKAAKYTSEAQTYGAIANLAVQAAGVDWSKYGFGGGAAPTPTATGIPAGGFKVGTGAVGLPR